MPGLEQHMQAEERTADRPKPESGKGSQVEIVDSNGTNTIPALTVSSETGLACLFRMGVQNGVYAEIGAVRRRNLIDGERKLVGRLIDFRRRVRPRSQVREPRLGRASLDPI